MSGIARAAALAALALCLEACRAPADPPRSVVLVTIDTLRADILGAYGSSLGATPQLDRLAEEGVLFEQAQAASPNTLPSHATLLTGKRPFRHRVRSNIAEQLAAEQLTLAEHLAKAGFATGAEVASVVLARHTGIDQGFGSFRDTESPDVHLPEPEPGTSPEIAMSQRVRSAEDITDRGLEFMEHHRGEPFFLWLHYYDAHWPYTPPEPWKGRFEPLGRSVQPPERGAGEIGPIRLNLYAGEVAYVDDQLGRIVDALERLGLDAHTLLVVTSDHGESLGEHREDTHGYYVYQSTMRVPLLFWGPPGLGDGVRIDSPVRPVDLAPTLLDWLGETPLPDADGRSLLPLVAGEGDAGNRVAYGESIELQRVFGADVLRFVREGRWKYVHKPRPSLYDLAADPGERRDVAERHPEVVARLYGRLESLLTGANAAPATTVDLAPDTAAQLEALGYAVAGPVEIGDELASLEVEGPDPEDLFADVRLITNAWPPDGDRAAHVERMRGLAARHPESATVLERLLDAQLAYGLADDAVETLRRGVRVASEKQRFWSNLGELLVNLGRREEALEVLPQTLARFPCDHASRILLAQLRGTRGDHAARIELLREGVEADCEETSPELQNELAYALATAPEASLRDGPRAVELARRAVEGLPENPLVLDTLAVALAESGDRASATRTLEHALELARRQQLPDHALRVLSEHAAAVAAGEPVRE